MHLPWTGAQRSCTRVCCAFQQLPGPSAPHTHVALPPGLCKSSQKFVLSPCISLGLPAGGGYKVHRAGLHWQGCGGHHQGPGGECACERARKPLPMFSSVMLVITWPCALPANTHIKAGCHQSCELRHPQALERDDKPY
eukprot:1161890-Pelagomonas_calceolata.AAC.6